MNAKIFTTFLVIFSIWTSLFAPFISAQTISNGLQFRISEAKKNALPKATPTPAKVEKLNNSEANEIFRRLPPMFIDKDDDADFKMRSDSLKPPKTGRIIPIIFPDDERKDSPSLPNATTKPLEIERFTPNGNVPIVTDLSITFSQPMISVTSQTESSENVPIKLSPEVKGKWRWLGTQTLIFDAENRFPMATKFTATIPKNTKSAIGGTLAKDFTWTFSTPTAKIEYFEPKPEYGGTHPRSTLFAKFNQEIDESKILPKIKVFADGKPFSVELATSKIISEIDEDYNFNDAKPKHWLAFRTIETLPMNAEVKVVFEKGLPSAEGSAISETEQSFSFKTLETFKLTETLCGYVRASERQCQPSDDFRLRFNRSLYPAKLDVSLIKIEPPIENALIEKDGSGTEIYIKGKKKPNTSYKITLSGEAIDYYKQKIGQDISATFNVGVEQPHFFAQGGTFITLDPNAKPIFSIYTKNHPSFKVRIYSVTPEDFGSYVNFLQQYNNNRNVIPTVNFGKLILDKTVEIKAEIDVLTETRINLSEAIPNQFGHAIVIVEPIIKSDDNNYQYYNQPIITWLQATSIGIDAFIDYEKLNAFVTDLRTGKPISNAEVKLLNVNRATDENGIVQFDAKTDKFEDYHGNILISSKIGDDSAIFYDGYADWRGYKGYSSFRWFVFDDRKMYRPNEEVSIKGYIRQVTGGKFTDIAEIGEKVKSIKYVLRDSRNNQIAFESVKLNAFGAFDFKIKLPENINLGYMRLGFWSNDNPVSSYPESEHTLQVQEFRRPEFEVSVESETPQPYFVGKPATISAEAKYYTGGFLQNSAITWDFCSFQTSYSPPNNDDFTFGTFVAWWKNYDRIMPRFNCERSDNYRLLNLPKNEDNEDNQQNVAWKTDENGKHRINLEFLSANPARPYTLQATAQVEDVNRQVIADTQNFLVHPSDFYVGLRTKKTFVRQDEPLTVEAIATDIDGKKITNSPISIKAELKDWQRFGSNWQQVTLDTQTCNITSNDSVNSCNFTAKQGGVFTISATVLDPKERPNTSEITIWVAGGNTAPKRGVEKEDVELIPDKREYSPEDTAEILVNSPYESAEGVMTLERNGIIKTERFTVNQSSAVLKILIEERYLPNFHVKVELVSIADRTNDKGEVETNLPKRPAFASGELNLNVSKASRKLNVLVEPTEKITEPSGKTNVNIEVKDNLGNAVANSEVALIVVDESVLALADYKIQNPLDAFYQPIQAGVSHYRSRQNVVLANPNDIITTDMIESLPINSRQMSLLTLDGSKADGLSSKSRKVKAELNSTYQNWLEKDVAYIITPDEKRSQESQINVRRNFDALAIFSPSVITNENGKATVNLKLPDNLTRYRITAVAVTKSKQFGLGESNITAKQSLQVRPSAPRFMNFGDKAELPVVLQNQTDSPLTINVAIRANNANLSDGNGKKVTVAASDRVEIRFPITTQKVGTARFQIGAVSGKFADAAEIEFPVYTPATSETFATYGTTEENGAIVQNISAPKDVYAEFGGLEITTSSTQLQELTDAFIYLSNYSFDCSEQVSSRMLSVAALRDVLTAFESKDLPSKEAIEAKMKQDIERLQKLQHSDGGFSFWRSDDESIPYLSVHVAHAIARAKAKDYKIPSELISKSLSYLSNIEAKLPKEYSDESRWAISAYALYVRDLFGEKDTAKTKKLLQDVGLEKLSAESIGWILSVLADDKNSLAEVESIKQNLLNRVTETAGNAHFTTTYKDGEYVLLSSERRADAVILEALLKVESRESRVENKSSLIPKIVRGLLANRIKGRWQSTQENAFVLLALDKYFQTYEKVTPNFVAKIWLGNTFAGEQKFAGRSTDSNSISVPMNYLQTNNAKQNLILDKQGEGRLYYRIGLKYAPKNLKLDAADYGFAVSRTYEAVDNPEDVKQNSDGSWTIKSGSRVRVRVKMVAPTRRYHVALVDNLPAGIEIINRELATSRNDYVYESDEYRRRSWWFQHQNLRDNRAEAFTTLLQSGVWNYSYLARATTPGNFVVPPAKAEEMYAPETFGRSKTDFVKVE